MWNLDINFDEISEEPLPKPIKSRRQQAIQFYEKLQKRLNPSQQFLASQHIDKKGEQQSVNLESHKDKANKKRQTIKEVSNEHTLIFLQGLLLGDNMGKTRRNYGLHQYPMSNLKNLPKLSLLKLSKIFMQLLPKKRVSMSPTQFYQRYFRTQEMLRFYRQHRIDLMQTFHDLFFIKDWQIKNNEYLKRGYAMDYLPQEISQKLASLPKVYDDMEYTYDTFAHTIKTREKRKKTESKQFLQKHTIQNQEVTQTGLHNAKKMDCVQQNDFFLSENQ